MGADQVKDCGQTAATRIYVIKSNFQNKVFIINLSKIRYLKQPLLKGLGSKITHPKFLQLQGQFDNLGIIMKVTLQKEV